MSNFNQAVVQYILNLAKTKRVTHVIHNRQADDFGRRFEVLKWVLCCHSKKLGNNRKTVKFF